MDNRFKTIFSERNDNQSRSLASFGKASLANSGNYALSGTQMKNNIFQAPQDDDVVMKFFEGDSGSGQNNRFSSSTGRILGESTTSPLKTQITNQGFQEGQRSYTDNLLKSKASHFQDPHQQLSEQEPEASMNLENDQMNNTNRRMPKYQNSKAFQSLDSGRYSSLTNNLKPNDIDYDRISIKPHNPYLNHTNGSHLFAIKAQISREFANTNRTLDNNSSPGQTSARFDTNSYGIQSHMSGMNNLPTIGSRFSNATLTQRQRDFGSSLGITDRNYPIYSPEFDKVTILPESNPTNEKLERAKKYQNELELRKELLVQVEDRKKREEEEKRKKRLDEALEEEKIRREIQEFERVYGVKYAGLEPRNLNLSLASELERAKALAKKKDLFASLDTLKPAARKPTKKRPRTPIEEVERIMKIEKKDIKKAENPDQIIQKIPYAIQKQINQLIDDGFRPIRGELYEEQKQLSDQVKVLQREAQFLENERIHTQREAEALKLKLKQNQAIEEKKQTAVYTELIKKKHNDPNFMHSTSTVIDPEVQEEIYSLSTKLKRKGYWNNLGKKREQEMDSEVRSSSQLLSLSKRGKIFGPEDIEYDYPNAPENGSNSKYNEYTKLGNQDRLDEGYGIYNTSGSHLRDNDMMSDAMNLLRKNKDRLKLLDEIEDPDVNKLGQLINAAEFGDELKLHQNDRHPNEGLEDLRNRYLSDYSDTLIEKINSVGFYA